MKLAIVVGNPDLLPSEVAEVLRKLNLNPMKVEISRASSIYRREAKAAYMEAIERLKIPLEEGMAIVRLSDNDVVLAQGARSAILHLTLLDVDIPARVDPVMISFSRGQVVAVRGDEPYPIPA
ncbi:MAG: hypothetical protein UV05_C0011G0036 [candidate division CPR1 bacterium GW2011_GWA2_42_17]|uniref:Uncharacterized protein n=1 Tax=candidate division CPR1 bacterium GW2011_GWA2_42_17 TaxID=1618341 RepID=A0A0G0Z644_9BACT|nr:MAG: hypothetical protein UV05_C0011G0036 [candidate division CPR1 bacterium GW2011_GWA2_42_17]